MVIELVMVVLLVNEAQSVLVGPIYILYIFHSCIIFECRLANSYYLHEVSRQQFLQHHFS